MADERERIVLAGAEEARSHPIGGYREIGGYAMLERARGLEPQQVLDELLAAGIRGRGGAGFPMGRKASFLAKGTVRPTYLSSTPTSRSRAPSRTARSCSRSRTVSSRAA